MNVTPRLCLKQRKKILFIETNNKEPITSSVPIHQYLSHSLSHKSFLSIIHHCSSYSLLRQYINFFFFFYSIVLPDSPIQQRKRIFIHLFIHRTSSQHLNINNFHPNMIFSPILARKCIEMFAKSKNDHNNFFIHLHEYELFIKMNKNHCHHFRLFLMFPKNKKFVFYNEY